MSAVAFEADHPGARVEPSLGYRRGKYQRRTRSPAAVIIHTTGFGPVRRFRDDRQRRRHRWATPHDAALAIYRGMMEAGPHYVVGQGGELAQLAPEGVCAWHVGGRGGRHYRRELERWLTVECTWWASRWPGLRSPRELAGGRLWLPYDPAPSLLERVSRARWIGWREGGSVNANTIGIEVVPAEDHPRGPWSDEAWRTLLQLVGLICGRHGIPQDAHHVLTHSDAHPRARSRRGRPWDTWREQWTWEQHAERAGLPVWCPPPGS